MFESIVGHKDAIRYFINCIQTDTLSHAYLLHGPKEIGKTTLATLLARYLLCESEGAVPCGVCPGCTLCAKENHPDFQIVSRFLENGIGPQSAKQLKEDKAPKSISVDAIRAVKADSAIKPFRAKKKIYLILEADLMTTAAQNSFLKLLEDPPGYVVIILVTDHINAILDTVQSRCVTIGLAPPAPAEIEQYLAAHATGHDVQAYKKAAVLCGGSVQKATALLDNKKTSATNDQCMEILSLLLNNRQLIDAYLFFEKNKVSFMQDTDLLLDLLRDILCIKLNQQGLMQNMQYKDALFKLAKGYCVKRLVFLQEIILAAKRKFDQNINYSLLITEMLQKCGREDIYDRSSWRAV